MMLDPIIPLAVIPVVLSLVLLRNRRPRTLRSQGAGPRARQSRGSVGVRIAAPALAAFLMAGQAAAQDAWDLYVSPEGDLTVASVTYEGGLGLAVQCRSGNVEVALLGLPAALPGEINQHQMRRLATGFAPGPLEEASWITAAGATTALSSLPLRGARGLKRGGVFVIRTTPGAGAPQRLEMPLPADSSAIDRTLEACGKRTVDPRDDLLLADDLITPADWGRARLFEMPRSSARTPGKVEVSCIVAEGGRVRDCQVESETAPGLGARMLRDEPNVRLGLRETADMAVGRVIYLVTQGVVIRR